MTAKVLDGKRLAADIKGSLTRTVKTLAKRGIVPTLAIVQVGHDPASDVYVRGKVRDCEECDIAAYHVQIDDSPDCEYELFEELYRLNYDPSVDGIIVQLPLPDDIDASRVAEAIAPEKDVDGVNPYNRWCLSVGDPLFEPCTPAGIMHMLNNYNLVRPGLNAVVVGRSQIVGRPMAEMLTLADMTVTLAHSKTKETALRRALAQADIVVSAVGKPGVITGDMVKFGSVLVDVGITRGADGKIRGDFADDAWGVASYVSPVPGGVGPMTRAMLMCNVVKAAKELAWV